MKTPLGFRFAGVRCGLKNRRNDLGLILSDRPARAAGVFTQNLVHAACVDVSRQALASGRLRGLVVNSGNANCCTGVQGERDAHRMADLAREALGLATDEPFAVASTGVIGQLLDMGKVEKGIHAASQKLADDPRPFMDAILTTDLVEKWACAAVGADRPATPSDPNAVGDGPVVLGIAKGSGMIAPNMATMLGFLVTDADLSAIDLDAALRTAADLSFNCMLVDGDTSTNDMLLVLANGASGVAPDPGAFQQTLNAVCISLAKQIARDGEGATKLVEVRVRGSEDPRRIARTIAESPLVKTAMFGCDPNWGRIVAAAGRSGVPFDPGSAVLRVRAAGEEFVLFEDGAPAAFDAKRVSAALKSDEVVLDLWLSNGPEATVYTCDFGYGYVRINAEYHT